MGSVFHFQKMPEEISVSLFFLFFDQNVYYIVVQRSSDDFIVLQSKNVPDVVMSFFFLDFLLIQFKFL